MGPSFAVSPELDTGVLFGDSSKGSQWLAPYHWLKLANPSQIKQGRLTSKAPLFPAVSNAQRVTWLDVSSAHISMLELATGKLSRYPANGADDVGWWDDHTLIAVGSGRPGQHWAKLVSIKP